MAFLDIMILDHKDNEISSICIDSQAHEFLFKMLGDKSKYHYLYKIEDFYHDARFDSGEIHALRKEIIELRSEIEEGANSSSTELHDNAVQFLKDFESLCEKALGLNLPIQCFSD